MKKILFLFLLSLSISGFCQDENLPENTPSKWRFGGGLGLGFGSNRYFAFSISPFAGYEIIPQLEAGVTAGYQYSKWSDSRQNLFSVGPYVNYYPIPEIFLRSHYEFYTGTQKYDYGFNDESYSTNFNESALWLGGGYRNTGRIQFFVGMMYNVLYDDDTSLFSSGLRPIVGVSIGL